MPNWSEICDSIDRSERKDALDYYRREYLQNVHKLTGRNIIAYYSGYLQKQLAPQHTLIIDDNDKNGFMTVIHKLDRSKGLDLILHTPGGDIAATESIVEYLKIMFANNIRVIVPQIAMSAGTMMACASKEIIMGKQSSLGPIDPQYRGMSAHGVVDEFERAKIEITSDPASIPLWQVIISKYQPTFIGDCEHAIDWGKEIVTRWLKENMFYDDKKAGAKVKEIVDYLSSHKITKAHSRHIGANECKNIGLKILDLEDNDELQDNILSLHHCYMFAFGVTSALKIIENHNGTTMVRHQLEDN